MSTSFSIWQQRERPRLATMAGLSVFPVILSPDKIGSIRCLPKNCARTAKTLLEEQYTTASSLIGALLRVSQGELTKGEKIKAPSHSPMRKGNTVMLCHIFRLARHTVITVLCRDSKGLDISARAVQLLCCCRNGCISGMRICNVATAFVKKQTAVCYTLKKSVRV